VVVESLVLVVPIIAMYKPKNINMIQNHWIIVKLCPYNNTDNNIVINLRVVVIMVVMTGVNQVMVKKMNICPHAAAIFKIHKFWINDRYGSIIVLYKDVRAFGRSEEYVLYESFPNVVVVYNQWNCPVP
jgi:hypothetical protein